MVLVATLNEDDTEVMIQYQTDFATLAHAQEIQAILHGDIDFLGSTAQQGPPAADMSDIRRLYDTLYDAYFGHIFGLDEASALGQWRVRYKCMNAGHFPLLPCATYKANANASASYMIDNFGWRDDYEVTIQILASWAILQACYTRFTDVLVGNCSPDAECVTAGGAMPVPTPMQLSVSFKQRVVSCLDPVQSTITAYSELPKLPEHKLRGISDELAFAYDFRTVQGVGQTSVLGQIPNPNAKSNAHYHRRAFSM